MLKLLRAGCTVVTTTRFPHDAALRFAAEADSAVWFSHLSIIRLDLRDIRAVQTFAAFLLDKFDRIDILINNAAQVRPRLRVSPHVHVFVGFYSSSHTLASPAQTIWRPDAFYRHLLPVEGTPVPLLASPLAAPMLAHNASFLTLLDVPAPAPDALVPLCADAALFPAGVTDMHGQQLDLRPLTTSWTLTLPQVPVPELAEVSGVLLLVR